MTSRRLISAFVCVVALSACASTKLMDGIISSWVGESFDDVVMRWGAPDRQLSLGEKTVYVWVHRQAGFIPQTSTTTGQVTKSGTFNSQTTTSGGYAIEGVCERLLEIDAKRTVVRGSWRGNNCPFMEVLEYATWRNPNRK